MWRKGKLKTIKADPQARTTKTCLDNQHYFEADVDAWRDRLAWLRRAVRSTQDQADAAKQRLQHAIEDCPHRALVPELETTTED